MPEPQQSAGDPISPVCEVIEVHVAELKQLFNAIDPSPFREKDLDANAEEFIVAWARDLPRDVPLALLVYLDRPAGLAEEPAVLRDAGAHRVHARCQFRGLAMGLAGRFAKGGAIDGRGTEERTCRRRERHSASC